MCSDPALDIRWDRSAARSHRAGRTEAKGTDMADASKNASKNQTDETPTSGEPAQEPGGAAVWAKRLIPLVILIGLLVAAFYAGLGRYLSLDYLSENREVLTAWVDANRVLAIPGFIALYTLLVAISFPGAAFLTIIGGFLFGPLLGTVLVVTGATLGATIIFLAARTALGDPLRKRAGGFIKRMEEGFREDAMSYLLVLRLVPVFPFWVVNLVPAFLGVPLRTFVLATALGIIPGSAVYVGVGDGLGAVLDQGGQPDWGLIFNPRVLVPILGLALLSLVPVIYRKVRERRSA